MADVPGHDVRRPTAGIGDADEEMAAAMPRPRKQDQRCSGMSAGNQAGGNAALSLVRPSFPLSEAGEYNLALRLSALDERVGAAQVLGVDGAELVIDGAPDAAGVHQLGHLRQ